METICGFKSGFFNIEKVKCPICMDLVKQSKTTTTKCGHQFCSSCLDKWEEQSNSCPMCRAQLQEIKKIFEIYIFL